MSRIVTIAGEERHMKAWRRDRPDPRDRMFALPPYHLPDAVDLRPHCPPIVDQGNIGSCTANSSAAAMAFLERKDQQAAYFSRLFIYAMTRTIEGTPLSEDSGAEIRDVMKALSTYGAPYETDFPYDPRKFTQKPGDELMQKAAQHKALFYYRCPDIFTVRASLAQGFPVVFGFSVPDNFMSDECARTGICKPPVMGEGFDGGHAVLAVGYDINFPVTNSLRGAVLCQNSWGAGWGQKGFFWLPMIFWENSGGPVVLATDNWTIRLAMV